MNPYSGENFFGFFLQLFYRLIGLKGPLVSDEIQMIVLVAVAVSGALVGTFLVLRKMTMLANSLSHTILIGIVFAFLLSGQQMNLTSLLFAAFTMGIITTFLTEFFTKRVGLQEDASIGLVFTSLFALGVISATILTRNAHIGTEAVMGNVDALMSSDIKLVAIILAINALIFFIFFKEFKITTFDPSLSKALGISPIFFNYLLMTQVSGTAIGGFRAVGVLMILAFITGPPLTARLITHDLKKMLFVAIALGSGAAIIGVAIARHLLSVYGMALSTSGVVVCTIFVIFLVTLITSKWRS